MSKLKQHQDLDRLRKSLETIGFIYIKNHEIPNNLVTLFFNQGSEFFDKSTEYKSQFAYDQETNAGWLRIGEEQLNRQHEQREQKEAFNIRKDDCNPPDPFVVDVVERMIRECHRTCMELLRAFANCLAIPDEHGGSEYFVSRHRYDHQSGDILRCLHYPGLSEFTKDLRGGGHSDFGALTLLFTQSNDPGGLEILDPLTNEFVAVPNLPGHIIVNTGDLMEYWTGSFFRSTIHRVVVPMTNYQQPRYSIAYFCNAEENTTLEIVPSPFLADKKTAKDRKSKGYEDFSVVKLKGIPKTAHEHLMMRLERIHVQP